MKTKAVVDLGSLKAKLSVFDIETSKPLLQKSYLILLGKSIAEEKRIVPEAIQRLTDALIEIKKELEIINCTEVTFIATESLRIAVNKEDAYILVDQYFPGHKLTILDQDLEGDMFFKVVSRAFSDISMIAMDIGGGSVQVFHGIFDSASNTHIIDRKYLYKTGTYKLQQKYSPDNEVISSDFEGAIDEVRKEYAGLDSKGNIAVFGSTCMQDFLRESGIKLYNDRPFPMHEYYTKKEDIVGLLKEIRKFPPDKRSHLYPSGDYFIYGADYLLVNLLEMVHRTEAKYIYPTNFNSSYGFI